MTIAEQIKLNAKENLEFANEEATLWADGDYSVSERTVTFKFYDGSFLVIGYSSKTICAW